MKNILRIVLALTLVFVMAFPSPLAAMKTPLH